METQALQPRGVDAATGNIGELQAKLEHAGLQMQVRWCPNWCYNLAIIMGLQYQVLLTNKIPCRLT